MAQTTTGLKVTVDILTVVYETGKNVSGISSKTWESCSMIIYPARVTAISLLAIELGKLFLAKSLLQKTFLNVSER